MDTGGDKSQGHTGSFRFLEDSSKFLNEKILGEKSFISSAQQRLHRFYLYKAHRRQ